MNASLQKIIDQTQLQHQLLPAHRVPPSSDRLFFHIPTLDAAQISVPIGALSEWGLPSGKNGRRILAHMLKMTLCQQPETLCLWIHNGKQQVYPPSWAALGVPLQNMYFAEATQPLRQLRPVFLQPLFKIIVIDRPQKLGKDDCAFLTACARLHQFAVVVLRDFFLHGHLGNPYAHMRVNAWYNAQKNTFHAFALRGAKPQHISFTIPFPESSYE